MWTHTWLDLTTWNSFWASAMLQCDDLFVESAVAAVLHTAATMLSGSPVSFGIRSLEGGLGTTGFIWTFEWQSNGPNATNWTEIWLMELEMSWIMNTRIEADTLGKHIEKKWKRTIIYRNVFVYFSDEMKRNLNAMGYGLWKRAGLTKRNEPRWMQWFCNGTIEFLPNTPYAMACTENELVVMTLHWKCTERNGFEMTML